MSKDKNFKPKGKKDFISELSQAFPNLSEDVIETMAERELKHQERFSGVLKQKKNRTASAENAKRTLEKLGYDKDGNKLNKVEPAKEGKEGDKKVEVSTEDMSYFFSNGGSRTELRKLKQIMAGTGKNFDEAMKDSLFVAFQKEQKQIQKSKKAQLPPGQGGSRANTEGEKIEKEISGNLPIGFSADKKK